MSNNTLILIAIIARAVCVVSAVLAATYLANNEKEGWGWMIFLAIVLGSYGVKNETI